MGRPKKTHKTCSQCGVKKPRTDFYQSRNGEITHSQCKVCYQELQKQKRSGVNNPEHNPERETQNTHVDSESSGIHNNPELPNPEHNPEHGNNPEQELSNDDIEIAEMKAYAEYIVAHPEIFPPRTSPPPFDDPKLSTMGLLVKLVKRAADNDWDITTRTGDVWV